MATTVIHPITKSIGHAISYAMGNKLESYAKDEADEGYLYELDEKTMEATYFTLTALQNCGSVNNPVEDFKYLANRYGYDEIRFGNPQTKDGKPILGWHLIQSFDGRVEPDLANEIGQKLAKEIFPDNPAVISTHTNTDNTHNHIVVCAWKLEGGKWNLDHESYRKIRACSDRLCDEHGFPVLEHTRNQRLVSWKDKNGKTHYYEPTARKNELIEKRNTGKAYPDDVSSYRNTMSYELSDAKKRSNIAIVKQAIDEALPYAISYEHLLMLLKVMGVESKSKRKNGKYLEHTTFIHPLAYKGVRDSSLDKETGFYERENLTKVIEEQNKAQNRKTPCVEVYCYGRFNIQCLDEDNRIVYSDKLGFVPVERSDTERTLIRSAKEDDAELKNTYDLETLNRLIDKEKERRSSKLPPLNKPALIIRDIQESFETLHYIEKTQSFDKQKLEKELRDLRAGYTAAEGSMGKLEDTLMLAEKNGQASPETVDRIRKRLLENKKKLAMIDTAIQKQEGYIRTFNRIKESEKQVKKESVKTKKRSYENER